MRASSFRIKPIATLAILIQCHALSSSFSSAFSSHSHQHAHNLKLPSNRKSVPCVSRHVASSRAISPISRGFGPIRAADDDVTESTSGTGDEDESIDINSDPRLCRVRLPRAPGIEWGTDLSFSFVYIRDLEPAGAAALSGVIEKGDQICELRPVKQNGDAMESINLIGAAFDQVMGAFASLGKDIKDVDLVFFRGTKDELKELCAGGSEPVSETITITVIQNNGAKDETTRYIVAKAGCNLRQVLTDNEINVYQSVTRWTNCKGKQLCGTCIVNVADGSVGTNRKSLDEASTLRDNPESYRLSCVTFAYADITVETFPPIGASQWTR